MTRIVIRNFSGRTTRKLCARAAENKRSMEGKTPKIFWLCTRREPVTGKGSGHNIHQLFKAAAKIDLDIPARKSMHEPLSFD